MGQKPFVQLATPRVVNWPELPPDLARFYSANEVIEFEKLDYSVYLNPLDEVKRIGWEGLRFVSDCPEGWEKFNAFLIGGSCYFEKIVYVIDAPCCQRGAILALGGNLGDVGGSGPFAHVLCAVLAVSFPEWLRHLEEEGWWEYLLGGGILELPKTRQQKLRAYYLALNPNFDWPET